MKYLRTIRHFSLGLLYIGGISAIMAQDLEEDIPVPNQYELSEGALEAAFDLPEERSILNILSKEHIRENETLVNSQIELTNDIRTKEEQLGMILRQAYYQKLTTPHWASILSTNNWRNSFLKWRYFAQLAEYVKNSTNELFIKKRRLALQNIDLSKQIAIISAPQNEEIVEDVIEEIVEDDNPSESESNTKTSKTTKTPEVESLIDEEEEWEGGNTSALYEFTMDDLTLSDEIVSEYASKPELEAVAEEAITILESDDIKIDESAEEDHNDEADIEIEGKKAQIVPAPQKKEVLKVIKEVPKKKDPQTLAAAASVEKQKVVSSNTSTVVDQVRESNSVSSTQHVYTAPSVVPSRGSINRSFANTKGRLSWPITGVITDRYGYRKNAAARGLKIDNYGIDMEGSSSANVSLVYEGTVLMTIKQAPYDYIVTVKHGDYTTAYYFLDRIYVNVGDVIPKGHVIGALRPQVSAPFHFEIWEGQNRLNPEPWLQPK